jgi:large subunit ribosomal protein L21
MAKSVTSAAPASAATLAGSGEHYAIVVDGGRQYRVSEGTVVRIEKLEAEAGATVEFDQVLLVGAGADIKVGGSGSGGG